MSNLSFLRSPHLDTKPKSSSVQLNSRLHRDTNHTFLSSRERLHREILKNAEIHYGLNGFEREIIIFLARFSLDIQSIPCPSFFSFFFPFLLFFFFFSFLLQLAPTRECIHKVAVHGASGLNYGSYFLWVGIAGWYPTFVYRSLRYGCIYSEVYVLFSL